MTCVMSSRSRPRAATSVATSVVTLPLSKRRAPARARSATCRRASRPRRLRAAAASARAGRRRASSARRRARARGRVLEHVDQPLDLAVGGDRDELVLDLAVGLRRGSSASKRDRVVGVARASSPTAPSSVAEKSIVWRLRRQAPDDPVDLGLEAHVEHPVGLVEDEGRGRGERDRGAARPDPGGGRAWRRGRARCAARFAWRVDRRATVDGRDRQAASAWPMRELLGDLQASSRVGTSTRAAGGSLAAARSTIGTPNARVLPEPVGALARTSRPGARRVGRAPGSGTAR